MLNGRKIQLRRARAFNDGIQHALVGVMLHHQTLAGIIHADDKIPAGVLAEMIRRAAPQYLDRLMALRDDATQDCTARVNGDFGAGIDKLLEVSADREIGEDQLAEIQRAGFERWLDEEVRAPIQTWVDPQFSSSTAAAS